MSREIWYASENDPMVDAIRSVLQGEPYLSPKARDAYIRSTQKLL
jgi:hypothetical protein